MSIIEQQLKSTQAQDLNVKRLHTILPQVSWLPSKRNPNTYYTIFSDVPKAHTFKSKLQSAITKYRLPLTVKINKTKTAAPVVSLSGVTAESLELLATHQVHCNSINFEPIELTLDENFRLASELNKGHLDLCKIILADITELSIMGKLTKTGLKTLIEVLKENNTLTLLDLGGHDIGAAGAKELADALKGNNTLTSLKLVANNIGAAGAKYLADALKENTTLTSLYLGRNNISAAGAKYLADALKENTTLTSLDLYENNIGAAGTKELADALKENTTLTSLNLEKNNIGDAGAKDLADALKENTTLTSLDLYENNIGTAGTKKLADALKVNTMLTSLDLGNNDIIGPGVKYLANALKANTTLTSLYLGNNHIDDEAQYLADALKENTTLTSLDLWGNDIDDAGVKYLADALKENTTLASLGLKDNNIGSVGAKYLEEALEENATLIKLDLGQNKMTDQQASLIEVSTTRNQTFKPNIELVSYQLLGLLLTNISDMPAVIAPLILDYAKDFNVAMMKSFTKDKVQNMTLPASTKPLYAEVVEEEDDDEDDHKKHPPLSQSRVSIATTSSSSYYHSPAKLASTAESDVIFQTGMITSQQIAERVCEKAFCNTPVLTKTAVSKATQSSRESSSTVGMIKSLGGISVPANRTKAHEQPTAPGKSSQTTAVATDAKVTPARGKNKKPEATEPGYRASTASSRAKKREKYTPLSMTPKLPWK